MHRSYPLERLGPWLFAMCLGAFLCPSARAAEIVLQASAVDKLVKQSLFSEGGRHYLKRGACSAYLEQPTTTLKDGRIWIRAHLSSRLGIENGGNCIGSDFASWVESSGRPVASGSSIGLDDVRIDSIEVQSIGASLGNGLLSAFPTAFNLDLKSSTQQLLASAAPTIQSTVDSVVVKSATISDDRLSIVFDFKLTAK